MQQHLYQPTSLVPKGRTAPMPPYAAANNMTTTELAKVGSEDELSKSREKELLATIAAKDKKIQQLEEKLETQSAFIESVLKLSDHYRQVSRQSSRRRVSWCASVDEADVIQIPQNLKTYASEIRVDDLSDSEDDLSSLDDWKPPEPSPEKKKPSDPLAIFKTKLNPKPEPDADASEVSLEVDCDEIFEQMQKKKAASSLLKRGSSNSSLLKRTTSKEGSSSMKRTTSKDESVSSVKRVASQEEKSVVQAIIEGLRNDDESIEF